MNKSNNKIIYIMMVFFLLASELMGGGGRRNGTGGAQELLIPISARGLALSGAYTAGITGIDAIMYNPAGLGVSTNSADAMFSYMNYIADIGYSFAAVAVHFEDFGSLGFSVRTLDFGDIPVTTVNNPEGTGAVFSPTFVVLGVTYSNQLTDRIRVGTTINLISEEIQRASASGVSFDAGVQYSGIGGVDGLKLGVAVLNFGPSLSFDGPDLDARVNQVDANRSSQFYRLNTAQFELPSILELGLAYETRFSDQIGGLFSTSFQNNNFSNDEYRLAAEFSYNDFFFLRGGYSYISEASDVTEEAIYGPTFGVGINFNQGMDITVDYAFRSVEYFDANHMVTVQLGF